MIELVDLSEFDLYSLNSIKQSSLPPATVLAVGMFFTIN